MYPSVFASTTISASAGANSNFGIALLQLFALFVVLRVLGIILVLRTFPLDDEEDDDEKDDDCEQDPNHNRHQKSIWILLCRVDYVWLFGGDPRAGDSVRVADPRLQPHPHVGRAGEVLDHKGAVLGHLGRVQAFLLLLGHGADADVLHFVLLNLAFLVLLWHVNDELNSHVLSCDEP